MREIKFRAWDRYTKEMIFYGFEIFNEEDNGVHSGYEVNNGDWVQLDLMQYTGLKDKNGVEIYEGDILLEKNSKRPSGISDYYQDKRMEVVFEKHYILFKNIIYNKEAQYYGSYDSGYYEYIMDTIKVIGNIYENPELLHVKE